MANSSKSSKGSTRGSNKIIRECSTATPKSAPDAFEAPYGYLKLHQVIEAHNAYSKSVSTFSDASFDHSSDDDFDDFGRTESDCDDFDRNDASEDDAELEPASHVQNASGAAEGRKRVKSVSWGATERLEFIMRRLSNESSESFTKDKPPATPPGFFNSTAWIVAQQTAQLTTMMPAWVLQQPADCTTESVPLQPAEALPNQVVRAPPGLEPPTTLLLQQLPKATNRTSLSNMLDSYGFHALYDFLYVPLSYKNGKSLGFAFINFTSHAHARSAISKLSSICSAVWSQKRQGLTELIGHYRDTTVMGPGTPDEYKPILLSNGVRVDFPIEERGQAMIRVSL
jgi:hypothetical protein